MADVSNSTNDVAIIAKGINTMDLNQDYRKHLIQFLQDPTVSATKELKLRATYYALLVGTLYKKYGIRILLRCLRPKEVLLVIIEVYEGINKAHQSGLKM